MKRESIGLIVAMILLVGGYVATNSWYAAKNTAQQASFPIASPTVTLTVPPVATSVPIVNVAVDEKIPLAKAEDLEFDFPRMHVSFEQIGGCVADVKLKEFEVSLSDKSPVKLYDGYEKCKAYGVRIAEHDLRKEPSKVVRKNDREIQFISRGATIQIERTFRFPGDDYYAQMDLVIRNLSAVPQRVPVAFEIGATSEKMGSGGMFSLQQLGGREVVYQVDDSVKRTPLIFETEPKREVLEQLSAQKFGWVGAGSLHFLSAAIPLHQEPLTFSFGPIGQNIAKAVGAPFDQTLYEAWLEHSVDLPPSGEKSYAYELFLGPKKRQDLAKYKDRGFVDAIDYGFFKIISWPLFHVLNFIHSLIGNWGVAIIILTFIIRIIFYPLSLKAYIAGKKMQKIQPEITALKEKYKDDKTKLNQEMMALMSQRGANPMSGCLPILPQMPVFFGLNSVFMYSFELRHAPFIFWINDLAAMDRLFITPGILAVLYYVQQKLMPMPMADPTQARMMQILPVVFAVMMVSFPSGLVLYTITNAAVSIVQQQYMMRRYKDL